MPVYQAKQRLFFQKTENRENQENHEADLCDGRRDSFNATESEKSGDEGDNDKDDGVTKHDLLGDWGL
jgi:hypothetical protein